MFAKIVKGKDPVDLESEVNKFLSDYSYSTNEAKSIEQLGSMLNDDIYGKTDLSTRRLKIYQVQQFIMQEVDSKSVSIINQQPVIKVSICLLLICGYE